MNAGQVEHRHGLARRELAQFPLHPRRRALVLVRRVLSEGPEVRDASAEDRERGLPPSLSVRPQHHDRRLLGRVVVGLGGGEALHEGVEDGHSVPAASRA